MLDEIRKHVPLARSLSDGRLIALLVAGVVLLTALADVSLRNVVVIGIVAGVWYARRNRAPEPDIRIAPARRLEADEEAPRPVPAQEAFVQTRSQDPLVARAEALLHRVEARA